MDFGLSVVTEVFHQAGVLKVAPNLNDKMKTYQYAIN